MEKKDNCHPVRRGSLKVPIVAWTRQSDWIAARAVGSSLNAAAHRLFPRRGRPFTLLSSADLEI